jgi:hypothetical protein
MNIRLYLKYIQEDISILPDITLYGDTFKLDIGYESEEEKDKLIKFLKKNYEKAKTKTTQWLKGIHDRDDYPWKKVDNVKRLKGYKITLETRNEPYFQIEWELIPYGIAYKKTNQKIKVKYIVTEIQDGKYVIDVAPL